MENAQKSSYLRTIGSVKHCRRPKIANPVSEWSCRESPSESCAKKLIECSREYNCRYLTVDINKKYIEDQIKAGETGSFFPEKVYRETSSD